MVRLEQLFCVLALIGITGWMGHAQEKTSEYISPSEAVQAAKLPG